MAFRLGRVTRLLANPQRHPKTSVYRFRQAVPANLRQAVAVVLGRDRPVSELIRRLGTRDPRVAKIELATRSHLPKRWRWRRA